MAFTLKQYVYVPPPDELDIVLEREDIERYVTHVTNGDRTSWHLEGAWAEPRGVKHKEVGHWDMETILANWAALYGAAPSAASLVEPNQPPDLTRPTVRLVACHPSASARSACSTRRSTVTMPTPRPNRQGKPIPNWRGREPQQDARDAEVIRLAFQMGLGQAEIAEEIKKQGYSPVTPDRIGQILRVHSGRDRVIQYLAAADEWKRFTLRDLALALDLDTSKVAYVLDGLLKKGIVDFRDVRNDASSGDHKTKVDIHLNRKARKSPLVAVVLEKASEPVSKPDDDELLPTDAGTMSTVEVVTNVGPDQQPDALDLVEQHVQRVAANARLLQQEIDALGAGKPEPEPVWTLDLEVYPSIKAIRDRAIKAQKLNAAAKILEEAGEDDLVLAIMAKTDFTHLELEIIELLRALKEIE